MNKKLSSNTNEQITIISNAEYIEQLTKFKQNKKQICELIFNNSISELNSIDKSASYRYFELLMNLEIKDLKIIQFVRDAFKDLCTDYHYGKDDLVVKLIEKGYVKFYDLEDMIFNNLEDILKVFSYDNLISLYKWMKSLEKKLNDKEIEIIKDSFINAIENYVLDSINDDIQEIVSSDIEALNYNIEMPDGGTIEDLKDLYVDEYYDDIRDDVNQEIINRLKRIFDSSPLDLDIKQIDHDYILYNVNIDDSIKSHVDRKYDEMQIEVYIESESFDIKDDEWSQIDEMFQ